MFWILGADGAMVSLGEMLRGDSSIFNKLADVLQTQFSHVVWEGLTFYDFIFPLFIFVTGVAIAPSLTRIVERDGMAKAHLRVLRRAVLLYVLGVAYYGGISQHWGDVRWLGVLQRIAICYLFASLLFLHLGTRGLLAVTALLLAGYGALISLVPAPGMAEVSFAPDANLANWIDRHYLPGRLWDETRDPEGLLSTLPAIATCLIGVLAGDVLTQSGTGAREKSMRLLGAGLLLLAGGYLWSLQLPLIKSIWTSSYTLVTGGYALIALGLFHLIADVWQYRRWATVFIWVGANAITLYLLAGIANFERLAVRFVGGDVGQFLDEAVTQGTGRFVSHAIGVGFAVAVAAFLYRRRIFIRV